jgi:hypothetical protein
VAGTQVIDQLIVKLGLDPRDFTKGEKEIAASALNTEDKVRKSSEGMGRSLTGLAAKWLTVGAIIAGIKKGVGIIDDVAERTRRLGIDSKNLGQSAAWMRNWENAVEMAGGSAEDARKSIGGLQRAIFDLAYNGQVSDSLVMLGRLGVQFQTATGEARDFNSVVLDTADAIERAQKEGMSRENAYQYLQQAGFDSGTANLILGGRAQIESELKAQQERHQVNADDIAKATEIRRASISKDQSLHNAGIAAMNTVGGIQQTINEMIANPSQAMDRLTTSATNLGTAFENWALKATGQTRGLRNNNPGNIKAVGNQRHDREGFRVFSTMEEGVLAANDQLARYEARGINTIEKVINTWAPKKDKNNVEAYIKDVVADTGLRRDQPLNGDYAGVLAAMFKHESGKGAPTWEQVADILTAEGGRGSAATPGAAASALPTPGAQARGSSYNKTDVRIDSITVNTQAKDAQKMAADMDGAVKRKLFASHAEQGMQ